MTSDARYRDQDLWIPTAFHKEFVETNILVSRGDPRAPFSRQVDLWWYALSVGVGMRERTPLPARTQLVKFNDGGILNSDPWRITHLELLMLSEQGPDGDNSSVAIAQMANEYAVTGFGALAEQLRAVADPQTYLIGAIVRLNEP